MDGNINKILHYLKMIKKKELGKMGDNFVVVWHVSLCRSKTSATTG
jgi:hypothetical protein